MGIYILEYPAHLCLFGGEVWSEMRTGGCFVLMTRANAIICIQGMMTGGSSEVLAGARTGEQDRVTERMTGAEAMSTAH